MSPDMLGIILPVIVVPVLMIAGIAAVCCQYRSFKMMTGSVRVSARPRSSRRHRRAYYPPVVDGSEVPAHMRCPITTVMMSDPVTCVCGTHNFERLQLVAKLRQHARCPLGGLPMGEHQITSNTVLREEIERFNARAPPGGVMPPPAPPAACGVATAPPCALPGSVPPCAPAGVYAPYSTAEWSAPAPTAPPLTEAAGSGMGGCGGDTLGGCGAASPV